MKYLIVGHGNYAEGVMNTLKFFKDDLENIDILSYGSMMEEELEKYVLNEREELCVITDLLGGSVNLAAMRLLQKKQFHLLTGVNISLLLELIFTNPTSKKEIEEIVVMAREQMVFVNEMMGSFNA